jgi:hypothetical protein
MFLVLTIIVVWAVVVSTPCHDTSADAFFDLLHCRASTGVPCGKVALVCTTSMAGLSYVISVAG